MAGIIPIPGFQEPFSSLSHLLGAGFFAIIALLALYRGRGNRLRVISLAIFGFGTVLLLALSGTYHLLSPSDSAREVVRRLDHAAIFVLIASSFTPIHMIIFRRWGRWGMLALIWAIALVFITFKLMYFEEVRKNYNLTMYLGMGWLGLFSGIAIWKRYGFQFMQPILWGGIAYSIGAILAAAKWPVVISGVVQSHEIFHIAVLIGLGFHWAFVYQIADGRIHAPEMACRVEPQT